jgi:hypothetical protein
LKSAQRQLVYLLVLEVFFAPAVPFRVVGEGVLGVTLVAVVGWKGVLVRGLDLRLGLLMVDVRVLLGSELLECGLLRLFSGIVDLVVCLVWFVNETDILIVGLLVVRLVRVFRILLCLPGGVVLGGPTITNFRHFLLLVFPVLQSFILLHRDFPPLFLEC